MTTAERPIRTDALRRAQGPHALTRNDGGYFTDWSDLPRSIEITYDAPKLDLDLKFNYASAPSEPLSTERRWSERVENLQLTAYFSASDRRLLRAQFSNLDVQAATGDHLASGITSVLLSWVAKGERTLAPKRLLALKVMATLLDSELPAILNNFMCDTPSDQLPDSDEGE